MDKRILIIPERSGATPNACAYVRLIHPLETLQQRLPIAIIDISKLVTPENPITDLDLSCFSAISTQRTSPFQIMGVWQLLLRAKEKGIPIHWDIDDMPFGGDEKSHESNYLSLLAKSTLRMKEVATKVTVSTQAIHKELASLFSSISTHQNALAQGLWTSSLTRNSNSVLYFGLEAHKSGLETISDMLHKRNLRNLKRMNFQIDAIGPFGKNYHPLINVTSVPNSVISYPRFASWLSQRNSSSIGLIYHNASAINRGKSAIKALEYSLMGLTTLSNLNEAVVNDPVREFISIASDADYVDEMLRLFQDEFSQEKYSRQAKEYVLNNRMLTNDHRSMTEFFSDFLN